MTLHDTSKLWALACGELESEDAALVQDHLEDCPDCRDELARVHALREAAARAGGSIPLVPWDPIDDEIGSLLERRAARNAGLQGRWRRVLVPLTAAAAVVLATVGARAALPESGEWLALPRSAIATPAPAVVVAPVEPAAPSLPTLLEVQDAQRARDGLALAGGALVTPGDSLRTGRTGHALVRLADSSRVRLAGSSQVKLARSTDQEAALALESGRVSIQASHAVEVAAGGFTARGVASVFTVSQRAGFEVAVSHGRVHVERPNALPMLVEAGHRTVFSAKSSQARVGPITPECAGELAAVFAAPSRNLIASAQRTFTDVPVSGSRVDRQEIALAPLAPPSPPPASYPPPPAAERSEPNEYLAFPQTTVAVATPPPAPVAIEGPMPVPAAPPVAAPAPTTPASPEADALRSALADKREVTLKSGMLLGETVAPPREIWEAEKVARAAAEFAPLPAQAAPPAPVAVVAPPASAPVAAAPVVPVAKVIAAADAPAEDDAEDLYLLRAERALKRGGCQRFLPGLEDIASDVPSNERSERARIVRARCFEQQGKVPQAQAEYARYLREAPQGDFAAEAERHATPAPPRVTQLADN